MGDTEIKVAKGKSSWPYRVQLDAPFAAANSEEISRYIAVEPIPKVHASRGREGDVVLYSFAVEDHAAMFEWRFGGKRMDA